MTDVKIRHLKKRAERKLWLRKFRWEFVQGSGNIHIHWQPSGE